MCELQGRGQHKSTGLFQSGPQMEKGKENYVSSSSVTLLSLRLDCHAAKITNNQTNFSTLCWEKRIEIFHFASQLPEALNLTRSSQQQQYPV